MSIQLTDISKTYGSQKAVNTISFEAKKGEIVGFLGPNGAGKSTTMKILTGFIQPTGGTVLVSGIDVVAVCFSEKMDSSFLKSLVSALYFNKSSSGIIMI